MNSAFSDIGIVYLDHLGDAVLRSGFVQAVRELWPQAFVTLVCSQQTADYWRLCPHLDRLMVANPVMLKSTLYAWESEKKLFDLFIAPRSAPDYEGCHLLVGATKATVRIGFRHPPVNPAADYDRAFTQLVDQPNDPSEHVSDTPYRLLEALTSNPVTPRLPSIWIGPRASRWATRLLGEGQWLAIGLGAAQQHKVWSPESFAAVAAHFAKQGWKIVLLGAPPDWQLAGRFLARHSEAVVNLVGATNVEEMAAVIAQCSLFIGNDSGPKHIAAALGKPVVEVSWLNSPDPMFGYDRNFSAIGTRAAVVKPVRAFTWQETHKRVAVESITPEAVVKAAEALLAG